MTASVARVGEVLRVGPRWAWLIAIVGLVVLAVVVAQATRLGMLPLAMGLALAALVTLVSFRYPLAPLILFVAMIPIEEVVTIDGLGTISRLAAILFALTYGVPRLGRLAFGAIPPAGWAYVVWSFLSLGWALSPATAWPQLFTLVQLFLIAILVADVVVQRPAIVRPLMWVYSVSAAATALIGIEDFIAMGSRTAAIEGQDPAQFAAVLVPAIIFGLYEVLNGDRRILAGAVALVTTAGVVVSGTRGAWLAVVVVVLIFILPRLPLRRQVLAIATMIVIGLVTIQIPGVADLLAERAGNAVSSGGAGRTDIWTTGIAIYVANPVLGVGYANFPVANTLDVARAADVRLGHVGSGPHDLVIGTIVELGPIGLLLLALFVLPLVLRRGWGPDAAMVQAALSSLLLAALFVDIVSNRKQVWLLIGFAAGLAMLKRIRSTEAVAGEAPTPDVAPRRIPQPAGLRLEGTDPDQRRP
jgi:O-antigen ligase